ncbi:phage holin family protein [Arenibacter latericius]|uniref:phage holin family protein n=1 Tax=Arenibacter latericius TaxID=86104 RepID=UPI0003FAA22E|nr:phage holin family protein [Arenibacter latericius]MDX1364476.1 phage holin family protein [Arenibacter latericius]
MALEDFKDNLSEVDRNVRAYIENTEEYYKLRGFKLGMRAISSLVKLLLIGSIALLSLFMLSFALAYGVGQWLNNIFLGFLIVGGIYILFGIICYLFRSKLDKPLLKKFSDYYFD